MKKTALWTGSFLTLYGVHAAFRLGIAGRVDLGLPEPAIRGGAVASLVALALLVAAYIATRDEVMRRLALYAAAASALATGVLSYGLTALAVSAPLLTSNIWAVGMLVFLIIYGALAWRAGS